MYDDVLNWFRSPLMMFLIVALAGGFGYLYATNQMHYIQSAYKMVLFMWSNFIKDSSQQKIQEKKEGK
jgi:hypothetical protein